MSMGLGQDYYDGSLSSYEGTGQFTVATSLSGFQVAIGYESEKVLNGSMYDGDLAIIYYYTATSVPEPSTLLIAGLSASLCAYQASRRGRRARA
jgi:hypothetical protein